LKTKTKLLVLTFAFVFMLIAIPVTNVRASADNTRLFVFSAADSGNLIPSSATGLIDTPIPFRCTGLIATTVYSIELDNVVQETGLIATSGGEIAFSITSNSAGTFTVEVVNSTGGTAGVVASATVRVNDLVSDIMPYIILLVTITILFGVVAKLKV